MKIKVWLYSVTSFFKIVGDISHIYELTLLHMICYPFYLSGYQNVLHKELIDKEGLKNISGKQGGANRATLETDWF